MDEVFGKYYQLVREKKIVTDEERIAYFKDASLDKLTEQDQNIINQIFDFLDK